MLQNRTYGNFMNIVALVKPEHVRGAINTIHFGYDFPKLYLNLACTYKPVTLEDDCDLPEWFDQLGLNKILIRTGSIDNQTYVIYGDKDKAIQLANYLNDRYEKYRNLQISRPFETPKYHRIIGKLLGYPDEDVELFIDQGINHVLTWEGEKFIPI